MKNNAVTTPDVPLGFRARTRDALRRNLLDIASRLLAEGGVEALSLRKIAEEAGASTSVIYTIFGGKSGLMEQLWIEGFNRLWQHEQASASEGAPTVKLKSLAQAYRNNALANPHYFRITFGGVIDRSALTAETLSFSKKTFQILVDAADAAIQAHPACTLKNPNSLAHSLWSSVHGFVSLELNGFTCDVTPQSELFETHIATALKGALAHQ